MIVGEKKNKTGKEYDNTKVYFSHTSGIFKNNFGANFSINLVFLASA